ncbi:hypothetical protein [Candidatus Mycobacterium methanotrophicum]|uniref:Uncharacterized protein n=1 Tax=Candidatus Mycobacterium methanotrophicum TaxID=2943498 RepID=A0ABY4QLB8_9MYCO|nr:hypothetical protein [Candidatus Mycobacterium methanotrophicum]UQX11381.1 hypothetical protein M5I08_02315 [Candidatus Mycobacterium methanotrophicum]
MTDVHKVVAADETPEADAIEQHRVVDPDDETGLDTSYLADVADRDANPVDVIDQAVVVREPVDD